MEKNKIYNEDCLETMKKMEDNFVDLTITSPPYDNIRDYNGYSFDFESIAKELYRITKVGGVVVWVVGDSTVNGSESGTSFKQALYFKECGFNLHDTMIYQKSNYMPLTHNRYEQEFEYMFILAKGKPNTFNPILKRNTYAGNHNSGTFRQTGGKLMPSHKKGAIKEFGYVGNVWRFLVGAGKNTEDKIAHQHPATFPDKLPSDHIKSWSNENDLIYDPFMGSGTTAKMAKLLNRNYIGSEISEEYCEIIKKRLAQQTLV